jgi:O-antigen ligase
MPQLLPPSDWKTCASHYLTSYWLTAGVLVMLTGMLWGGSRGLYPQSFYWFLAAPTVLLALLRPAEAKLWGRSPVVIATLVLGLYVILSLAWNDSVARSASSIKRPLYVLALLGGFISVSVRYPGRLALLLKLASLAAGVTAVGALVAFTGWANWPSTRLDGMGALTNPLLASHVLGFFLAVSLIFWAGTRGYESALFGVVCLSLLTAILATGSRTPLIALAATLTWIAAIMPNRKTLTILAACLLGVVATISVAPELVTSRGLSYRFEIWQDAWAQIQSHLWFGHGFAYPIAIEISGFDFAFNNPHNIWLSILHQLGLVGLLLWVALYVTAFRACLGSPDRPLSAVASSALVYGLIAGMTEGGSFLSRPKEHWYLIWIPLALCAAVGMLRHLDPSGERPGG